MRVYPRTYGGTIRLKRLNAVERGLSPHIRGNPEADRYLAVDPGSIPAHTGEPCSRTQSLPSFRVYPRTYGGTIDPQRVVVLDCGLSPHIRGNLVDFGNRVGSDGSIPAHTGEPVVHVGHVHLGRVYPRTYGGTQLDQSRQGRIKGSIPAHTGEPNSWPCRPLSRMVYPRTYGGTRHSAALMEAEMGLSPHIRGNRQRRAASPAAAVIPGVYPRTYGGTEGRVLPAQRAQGLSPHIRGNRRYASALLTWQGSIPAHTGEPLRALRHLTDNRVYPRTYGGTSKRQLRKTPMTGLSPHIRGNLGPTSLPLSYVGSIPAHTGEPAWVMNQPVEVRVYPRTYGGTWLISRYSSGPAGLSPHIRGNQRLCCSQDDCCGSIPAHTGEPAANPVGRTQLGVYPRTYGGTQYRHEQHSA